MRGKSNSSELRPTARSELASCVAAEVEAVLAQHDPIMRKKTRVSAGLLSGHMIAAISALSRRRHQAIDAMQGDLAGLATEFVATLAEAAMREFRTTGQPKSGAPTAQSAATFVRRNAHDDLGSMVVEDWAGPVAGPTFLQETFAIPRSTLYRWQLRNEVIGLRKGGRKFVFPLEQFVDGRPAPGIRQVFTIIGHPRLTWFWLTHECRFLNLQRPIDLLRIDKVDEVTAAARRQHESDGTMNEASHL